MRDYATIAPQFWSGETGRKIRKAGPNALLVAMYLLTTPHSNGLGLYYMPVMYIAHDLNLGVDETRAALDGCINAGFCAYDYDADVVWVFNMARYQIGERLPPKDNRVTWVARLWEKLPKCAFLDEFKARYAEAYGMADSPSATGEEEGGQAPSEAPLQPLAKPLGKPLPDPSGSPLPSPSPSPLESPSATGEEGGGQAPPPEHGTWNIDIKNLNIPIGETVNERRARSPERSEEGDAPVPVSPDDPGMEFVELRELYSRLMRAEGPRAGFAEYKQIKAARQWPGLARIAEDISARKEAGTWNPGFEIGLGRYLREQTWLAPITGRAQAVTSTPTEHQRRQQESRAMARARLAMREDERAAMAAHEGTGEKHEPRCIAS